MNEIGIFISTFGGAGLFIVFLINRDKTTTKEQTDAIKKMGDRIKLLAEAIDDNSYLLADLLDELIKGYSKRGNTKNVKERLDNRRRVLQDND